MINPAAGLRRQYADFNAWQTSSAFIRSLIDQPTILRLPRSIAKPDLEVVKNATAYFAKDRP